MIGNILKKNIMSLITSIGNIVTGFLKYLKHKDVIDSIISFGEDYNWDMVILPQDSLETLLERGFLENDDMLDFEIDYFSNDAEYSDSSIREMVKNKMNIEQNSPNAFSLSSSLVVTAPDFKFDSIFYVIFIYGRGENNIVTKFGVSNNKTLCVINQSSYKLNVFTDVADLCDSLQKEDNGNFVFIKTDAIYKMVPFIERMINKENLVFRRDFFNIGEHGINALDYMNLGHVYVASQDFMFPLQQEIQLFTKKQFMRHNLDRSLFPRFISFSHGVDFWRQNKDTEYFVPQLIDDTKK